MEEASKITKLLELLKGMANKGVGTTADIIGGAGSAVNAGDKLLGGVDKVMAKGVTKGANVLRGAKGKSKLLQQLVDSEGGKKMIAAMRKVNSPVIRKGAVMAGAAGAGNTLYDWLLSNQDGEQPA